MRGFQRRFDLSVPGLTAAPADPRQCEHSYRHAEIGLIIRQLQERTTIRRDVCCGECGIHLLPSMRIVRRSFPDNEAGWRRFVAAMFGHDAWQSFTEMLGLVRRGTREPKTHLARYPFRRRVGRQTWCDRTGKITPGQVSVDPRDVDCWTCMGHAGFEQTWMEYRARGEPWAQDDHDPFPDPAAGVEVGGEWDMLPEVEA